MAHGSITDEDLTDLIRRTAEANSALMRGDISGYLTLITHADDYTLMAPFGGAPARGFDVSGERLAELARFFKAGKSELELVQTYVSGDMGGSGDDRTAAGRGRWSTGPGLVPARHPGLSSRRVGMAVGASAC